MGKIFFCICAFYRMLLPGRILTTSQVLPIAFLAMSVEAFLLTEEYNIRQYVPKGRGVGMEGRP